MERTHTRWGNWQSSNLNDALYENNVGMHYSRTILFTTHARRSGTRTNTLSITIRSALLRYNRGKQNNLPGNIYYIGLCCKKIEPRK
ncbi:hypothetical protein Krac_1429 [Ktedonobacter racemifer DSM 44963]|uniref:Uncharacterized protein n=1 Tax=Ktedonobacter racemifer DSM 44963 TaxID=485913 RepID=D6U1F4_KTERA|nr:hypothetical protein Krac_1429 [Ktedonobacter racemifer DSM 44963]